MLNDVISNHRKFVDQRFKPFLSYDKKSYNKKDI